jgi:hypothetical protein
MQLCLGKMDSAYASIIMTMATVRVNSGLSTLAPLLPMLINPIKGQTKRKHDCTDLQHDRAAKNIHSKSFFGQNTTPTHIFFRLGVDILVR